MILENSINYNPHYVESELTSRLKAAAQTLKEEQLVKTGSRTLTETIVANALLLTIPMYRYEGALYMYNDQTHSLTRANQAIDGYIADIYINDGTSMPKHMSGAVVNFLSNIKALREPATPPRGVIQFRNGWFDIVTRQQVDPHDEKGVDYVPWGAKSYDFKDLNDVDPEMLQIAKKVFDDWSDGDSTRLLQMMQVLYSVLEGVNRNKLVLLLGSGGNGKSSFIDIAAQIAGEENRAIANLDEYHNDNVMNLITPGTSLITGADLTTSAKLKAADVQRFKLLVSGEGFIVNVKYEKSIRLTSDAVIIQSSNSMPRFFESTEAIRDRLYTIPWTQNNYRLAREPGFDLKSLIKTPEFIEAVVAYMLSIVEPFDAYIESQASTDMTKQVITSQDNVANFYDHLKELGMFKRQWFSPALAFPAYAVWLSRENPSAVKSMPSKRKFIESLKNVMRQDNIIDNDVITRLQRPRSFPLSKCNHHVMKTLNDDAYLRTVQSIDEVVEENKAMTYLLINDYAHEETAILNALDHNDNEMIVRYAESHPELVIDCMIETLHNVKSPNRAYLLGKVSTVETSDDWLYRLSQMTSDEIKQFVSETFCE